MRRVLVKFIFILIFCFSFSVKSYSQFASVHDSLQLVTLYNSTNGPAWMNRGGWLSSYVSGWYGVTLNANGRVTSLVLQGNTLSGALPALDLPYLQTLNLSVNQLTGTIPNLALPLLQTLQINNNRFSGDFPNLMMDNLVTLNCNINLLTGMAALNMPALQTLSAAGNQITGGIPNFVMPSLQTLSLNSNQFTGAVPAFNMPLLKTLNLSFNKLTSVLNQNLPAVVTIDISKNLLAGNIPAFSLPNLVTLNLSNNLLSGNIPVLTLPSVTTVSLNDNQLSGAIPPLSLPSITTLNLFNNQLSSIPDFNMPNLVNLYAYNNQLTGTIPDFNLPHLFKLQLYNNHLSGAVPSFNNTALYNIDLNHNELSSITGVTRSSIGTMNVSYNQITGDLSGFYLPNLWWLDLSHNQLSGPVADIDLPALQHLWLSYNQFTQVPDFNLMPTLRELRISNNLLTGNIVNFSHTPYLEQLSLDSNQLSGPLPYFDHASIYEITVSHNQLSGTLSPAYELISLGYLDISHNQFSGHFPYSQVFSEMYYYINDNFFTFDGLEEMVPQFNATNDIAYAPQGKIKLHQNDTLLAVTAGGTLSNNTYTWSKDDQEIAIRFGDSTFAFTSPGRYSVKVKNVLVPDLTLFSDTIPVTRILLVDPVYSLVQEDGTINTDINQADITKVVSGVSTDGISKILLYAVSDQPVSFHLPGSVYGTLSSFGGNENQPDIIANSVDGKAVAVYTAPDGFGELTADAAEKNVTITAMVGSDPVSLSVKLVTPPVILVHGMWSDPSVWDKGGFKNHLFIWGFRHMEAADYGSFSEKTFDPDNPESSYGRNAVLAAIRNELFYYRSVLHLAASQVDIVAHSLGGLMARSLSQQPYFKDKKNYNKGPIHKLITLATPHRGSPLGPELWNKRNTIYNSYLTGIGTVSEPSFFSKLLNFGGMPLGTCHKDFGIDSIGLSHLTATLPFKTFAVTCDYTGQTNGYDIMNDLCVLAFGKAHNTIMASRCEPVGPLVSDLIVPLNSQKGFHSGGKDQLFTNTGHSAPAYNTATNNYDIQTKVVNLLLSQNSDDFGVGFPASFSIPLDCNSATQRNNEPAANTRYTKAGTG